MGNHEVQELWYDDEGRQVSQVRERQGQVMAKKKAGGKKGKMGGKKGC